MVTPPGPFDFGPNPHELIFNVTTIPDSTQCVWSVDATNRGFPVSWIILNPTYSGGTGSFGATVVAQTTESERDAVILVTGNIASGSAAGILVVQFPTPTVNQGGTVSAASYGGGNGGSILSAFGQFFASTAVVAPTVPLPTQAGPDPTTVTLTANHPSADGGARPATIGPIDAPLFFVSPNQVNFQMPWEFIGVSQVSITVSDFGVASSPVIVNLSNPAPAIFTLNQQGTGQGAIQIANTTTFAAPAGSIQGASPAHIGDYLTIYCTGLGDVTNRPANGVASPTSPLAQTLLTATATVGGIAAPVTFSGLTPGFVALYQVNVQVPPGVATGNAVQVILSIGGVASNTVTIAVQ
jgi:uncharacterized protein (TIGR03437 family)